MSMEKTFFFADTYIDIYHELVTVGTDPDNAFVELVPNSAQEAKEMALALRKAALALERLAARMQGESNVAA